MGNIIKASKAWSSWNLNCQLPWDKQIWWLGVTVMLLPEKATLASGIFWTTTTKHSNVNIKYHKLKLSSVFRKNTILNNSPWECASLTFIIHTKVYHSSLKGYEVCNFRSWQNNISKLLYTSGAFAGAERPNAWDWGGPTNGQRSWVSTSSKSLQHKTSTLTRTYRTTQRRGSDSTSLTSTICP